MFGRPNRLVRDKDTKCCNAPKERHKGKLFTCQVNGSIQYRTYTPFLKSVLGPHRGTIYLSLDKKKNLQTHMLKCTQRTRIH